jgi:hypothetical protein
MVQHNPAGNQALPSPIFSESLCLGLKEDTRQVTRDPRRGFVQAVPRVLPEQFKLPPRFEYQGVRVTYGNVEAQNYTEQLRPETLDDSTGAKRDSGVYGRAPRR